MQKGGWTLSIVTLFVTVFVEHLINKTRLVFHVSELSV